MSVFAKKDGGTVLSREEILGADDIVIELVPVPEWGGDVYVKGMTGAERDDFEAGIVRISGKSNTVNMQNIRAKLCSATICDESGKKLFTPADIKELSKKSASALQHVFTVAQRLSGLSDDDVEELAEALQDNPLEDSAFD